MEGTLEAGLSALLGGDVQDLHRLSGGASCETWAFDLVSEGSARPLILRREPPGSSASSSLVRERQAIEAAARGGVRVPHVEALDDGTRLGRPGMVMQRVDGEALPGRILRSLDPDQRSRLLEDCALQLAAIHQVPLGEVPDLARFDVVERWRARLHELADDRPALELALRWLEEHRPPAGPEVLVHGDFRLGNLLVDQGEVAAVLDWELVHRGDPYEDLGWFCTKAWRFGSAEAAGGLGGYAELSDAYERGTGRRVDVDHLFWWEVMSSLKWGVMCVQQYHLHATGEEPSLELAALGWRTVEAEWDLLNLLAPEDRDPDEASADVAVPGRRPPSEPAAADIVDAVAGALRSDLLPHAQGRDGFTLRVAARLLEAVARVERGRDRFGGRQQDVLSRLGARSSAELAASVRADGWEWDPAVALGLREITRAHLELVNPDYLRQPFPARPASR